MSDNDKLNEIAGREAIRDLPITKLLVERITAAANADGDVEADDAIAPIVSAIASLERLVREGDG